MAAPQLSRWKNWLKTTGQMGMARNRCSRDSIARWNQTWILSTLTLLWNRLLENGVVRDIPRAEGAGMEHLTTIWEKTLRQRFASSDAKTDGRSSEKTCVARELHTALDVLWKSSRSNRRVPTSTLDCTGAYHEAPTLDDVVVEPPRSI